MRYKHLAGLVAIVGALACGSDAPSAPAPPIELDVVNYLATGATLNVGGVSLGSVPFALTSTIPGQAAFQIASGSQTVQYALAPFRYADGSPVPADFPGETITVPKGGGTLTLNNFVGAQPYFAFRVLNTGKETISVAVLGNNTTRCLGTLPDLGVQWYGYYTFLSSSEVRVYHNADCTGAYRFWANAVLANYAASAGTIQMQVTSDAAP